MAPVSPEDFPDPVVDSALADKAGQSQAVLAGGCFWCVEAVYKNLDGVSSVKSGYAGGSAETADYETVSTGGTNHAEAVEVTYDPSRISYGQILRVFFSIAHDPTQLNRQGPDTGRQYRSATFYADEEQKRVAEAYIAQLTKRYAEQVGAVADGKGGTGAPGQLPVDVCCQQLGVRQRVGPDSTEKDCDHGRVERVQAGGRVGIARHQDVAPQLGRGERQKHDRHQEQQIEEEQGTVEPGDALEKGVMIDPHHADREKTGDVGGVLRPGCQQCREQAARCGLVDLDIEDQ